MSRWHRYVFRVDRGHAILGSVLFFASSFACVVVAQTREALEAVGVTADKLTGRDTEQLLAFIAVIALVFAGWTQYVLFRMAKELHERPCYYKVAESKARKEKAVQDE